MALVLVAAGGTWWWLHRSSGTDQAAAQTQLVAATTGTLKETVSATGTIQPASQANLTAATAAANAGQIASANAQVTAAQSKVTSAQQALGQTTLTSPITGTVAVVNVAVGDSVSAGSSTSGASSPATGTTSGFGSGGGGGSGAAAGTTSASSASSAQVVVIATNAWLVNATVGASDLAKLKNGLQATITPSGASQPIFGTISTVGVIGTTSGGTSTFPVTVAVTGSPPGVYAGTTANVVITVKQVPDVLTVPSAAIYEETSRTVVHQMKDGVQVSTVVTVGTVYGTTTQITQGLSAGDEVVVAGRAGRTSTGTATGGTGRNGTGGGGGTGGQLPGQAPGGAPPVAPGGGS